MSLADRITGLVSPREDADERPRYRCEGCGERYQYPTTPCENCGGRVLTQIS